MNLTEDGSGGKNTNKSRNTDISWCVSVKNNSTNSKGQMGLTLLLIEMH